MRAYDIAADTPWAIQEGALRQILDFAARINLDPEGLAAKLAQLEPEGLAVDRGEPLEGTRNVRMHGRVATIPIRGPIFRYANLFSRISGATSVEILASDFRKALDSADASAIVLEVDSPGGEVTGVSELAGQIYGARGKKPVVAYVGGAGASAAYWLASAADQVLVAPSAIVGSIGILMAHRDTRAAEAKAGIRSIEIVSSQSPNKRPDPTTDEGLARIQAVVDSIADVFVKDVARGRGVTAETVLGDFGAGGVFVGEEAEAAGLADAVGTFEDVLASASQWGGRRGRLFASAHLGGKGDRAMPTRWERFKALMGGEDDPSAPGEDEEVTAAAQPARATPPAAAAPAPDPRIEQLQQQLAEERSARLRTVALGFAAGEITANRALPAVRGPLALLCLLASQDDAERPLAEAVTLEIEGETFQASSRMEALKAYAAKRPAHRLREELLPAGAQVLPNNTGGEADTEAKETGDRMSASARRHASAGKAAGNGNGRAS